MPITAPSNIRIGNSTLSDFVICRDFVFRPTDVDGFSYQILPDGSGKTVVNFKSFTQAISDPDRELFNFLVKKNQPASPDETF